jgi:uncharacterized membrane protein YczE
VVISKASHAAIIGPVLAYAVEMMQPPQSYEVKFIDAQTGVVIMAIGGGTVIGSVEAS